jgi:branched-chain amino acid transport system ATP-binding protein
VLAVSNLEVVYDDVVLVLRGVSLEVPDNKVVGLLGANGAGKTTLLRALSGLLDIHHGEVTRGRITLDGDRIDHLDPQQIVARGISQVLEGRRVFGEFTVEENLRVGAHTRPKDRATNLERVYTLFPRLQERRAQVAGYLSGGEQQMLAMGRAMMTDPRYLLLDEPSLGLAPQLVGTIRDLITQINESGTTVLLVEQNASMALSIADHGYVLENGRVVMDKPAADLLEDDDIREFYLGLGTDGERSFRDVKHYKRRKRWLS